MTMADEGVMDYLHSEIVSYIFSSAKSDDKENCVTKLEQIGFSTGYRIIERLTKDWLRFKDELDTVKFICKDFWMAIFKKQVDNLRTNHQGVYVLLDNKFRFLTQMSSEKQYLELGPRVKFPLLAGKHPSQKFSIREKMRTKMMSKSLQFLKEKKIFVSSLWFSDIIPGKIEYAAFSCGLLRGALANLGVQSVVTAEITTMPICKFQIQVQRS